MKMNIILSSSPAYLAYTATTIASICHHMMDGDFFAFHIMHAGDVTRRDVDRFRVNMARFSKYATFEFVEVRDSLDLAEKTSTSGHIKGSATYLRLYIPGHFRGSFSLALYLDSDLVVCRNIRGLFEAGMGGNALAGVEDFISRVRLDALWLPRNGKYVNAGVLVMDLGSIDQVEINTRLDHIAHSPIKYMVATGDQDLLALLFHDRMAYLDPHWNTMVLNDIEGRPLFFERAGKMSGVSRRIVADCYKNPYIIHYVGAIKPWMKTHYYDPLSKYWYKYAKMTGYYDEHMRGCERRLQMTAPFNRIADFFALPAQSLGLRRCYSISSALIEGTRRKTGSNFFTQGARDCLDKLFSQHGSYQCNGQFQLDGKTGIQAKEPVYILSSPEDFREFGYKSMYRPFLGATSFTRLAKPMEHAQPGTVLVDANDLPVTDKQAGKIENHMATGSRLLFLAPGPIAAIMARCSRMRIPARFRRCYSFRLDDMAFSFDTRVKSRFEHHLESAKSDITDAMRQRCRQAIKYITANRLSVTNQLPLESKEIADQGKYVLIVDQDKTDPPLLRSHATEGNFSHMAQAALEENPGSEIRIYLDGSSSKGYLNALPRQENLRRIIRRVNSHAILENAEKVYVCNAHLGFEALLARKRVITFADSFFSGWGLTDDRNCAIVRTRKHDVEELFHALTFVNAAHFSPVAPETVELERFLEEMVALRKDYFEWAGQWA